MTTVRETRTVHVQLADANAGTGGRPLLWAYGVRWLADVSGKSTRAVQAAIRRGVFDPGDPVDVVRWLLKCVADDDG